VLAGCHYECHPPIRRNGSRLRAIHQHHESVDGCGAVRESANLQGSGLGGAADPEGDLGRLRRLNRHHKRIRVAGFAVLRDVSDLDLMVPGSQYRIDRAAGGNDYGLSLIQPYGIAIGVQIDSRGDRMQDQSAGGWLAGRTIAAGEGRQRETGTGPQQYQLPDERADSAPLGELCRTLRDMRDPRVTPRTSGHPVGCRRLRSRPTGWVWPPQLLYRLCRSPPAQVTAGCGTGAGVPPDRVR
jgi:hypothetical protein